MSTALVSHNHKRLNGYDVFATALGYPEDRFFKRFPQLRKERRKIEIEYDSLFRNKGIWLYTTEYTASGQFQKINSLSDIMGFYRAFGLRIENERPDALSVELEFMHFLIYKTIYAIENRPDNHEEKAQICIDAQGKFFKCHLYSGAHAISEKINAGPEGHFYPDICQEMLHFLEEEKQYFDKETREAL
ncbi:MAG: hypothetical protein CMN78_06485 [Spirochaetales bacterium]|nr:hypothetical protein [Spirochaetales bacterium]